MLYPIPYTTTVPDSTTLLDIVRIIFREHQNIVDIFEARQILEPLRIDEFKEVIIALGKKISLAPLSEEREKMLVQKMEQEHMSFVKDVYSSGKKMESREKEVSDQNKDMEDITLLLVQI